MSQHESLALMLNQPWTVSVTQDPENGWVAVCAEMPDAIATADSPKELAAEFWQAVRASVSARLSAGLPVPSPAGGAPIVVHMPTRIIMQNNPEAWTTAATRTQVLVG